MWSSVSETGGYDYQFVEEPPDSLKCLICLLVARDPQQHGGCGKLFCQSCIAAHRVLKNDCPHCRQPLSNTQQTTIFNDFKSDQEVKSLMVVCSKSCGWKGDLRSLDEHIAKSCSNALVTCPNLCNNGQVKVVRKNLKRHMKNKCPRRKKACPHCGQMNELTELTDHQWNKCPKRHYQCPHCNEAGCYDERTTAHLDVCPKIVIQCPKCLAPIARGDTTKHSLTCPQEPVLCKYHNIGCRERPLRKDLEHHEKDIQLHLATATDKVLELTNALYIKNTTTFKVNHVSDQKSTDQRFFSPPFSTSRFGYKMCVRVHANGYGDGKGTHVSVFAFLLKGDNDDSLTWPFTGTVTFELLNQLEDKNHRKLTVTFQADVVVSQRVVDRERAPLGYGHPKFISHTELGYQPDKKCQYLKDDTLVFRVSAEASDYKPWLECST